MDANQKSPSSSSDKFSPEILDAAEGVEATTRSFSLGRVSGAVFAAMIVVTPTMYLLEAKGLLSDSPTCSKGSCSSSMSACSSSSSCSSRSACSSACSSSCGSCTQEKTPEFDLENTSVEVTEIIQGGPGKDGIPALVSPVTTSADQAKYLSSDDRVIGVVIDGEARAYPLAIMNYHEVANDRLGGRPIGIAYCPLSHAASVFDRLSENGEREFGVSGLLYNSNLLMFDRNEEAESLWSQVMNESIAGEQVGNKLDLLPFELTSWHEWQAQHPDSTVLSLETGHNRDYMLKPYANYHANDQLMFDVNPIDDRLPLKEKVLGVIVGDQVKAYPRSEFDIDRMRVEDEIDGKPFVVEFNSATETLRVVEAVAEVRWIYCFWFAWSGTHPQTELFQQSVY